MNGLDPDYRFMALTDLNNELSKETFKMDSESEKKLCAKVLKILIEDQSGDIQGLAVKW
jgi:cullin-associated NEDD8-dissociated protein 1